MVVAAAVMVLTVLVHTTVVVAVELAYMVKVLVELEEIVTIVALQMVPMIIVVKEDQRHSILV
tara:strand:- start:319 stop:507 length:189 start_codon:yes stop_codon:yes gene_type:complete